jgi:hypothetical protein
MHVAERNAHEPAGHARPHLLHSFAVGPGGAAVGLKRMRNPRFARDGDQALRDALVLRGAAGDGRPRAQRARTGHARLVGVRVVVGVRHVERDRDVGVEREGRRSGARIRGLLAHGRDGDHFGAQVACRCRAARRLEHNERTEAVVERARCEPRAAQFDWLGGHDDRIADLDRAGGVGLIAGSDVDPEVMRARRALAVFLAQEMPRGLAHDSGHRSCGGSHCDALTDQYGRVPGPDLTHEEHSAGVDVLHDQADLVDMTDQDHARAATGVHGRERAAERVAAHVGELGGCRPPDLCRGPLIARGPDCAQQTVQQDARARVDALLRHASKDS